MGAPPNWRALTLLTGFRCRLQENKAKVLQLEQLVSRVKTRYSIALRNLEQISEQIHAQRERDRAQGGCPGACAGRSPPVGAESDVGDGDQGASVGAAAAGSERVDAALQLAERYQEQERERAASDSLSVFSLQTIASDLEKYDSVEHLGDLSDVGSVTGDEGERDAHAVDRRDRRDRLAEVSKERQQQFYKQHQRSFSL